VTVPLTRSVVRTIAVDYDGTVAHDGQLSRAAAEALDEARRGGLSLVLVTGRILEELARAAPRISDRFDVIVAENGAVALRHGHVVRLAEPVDDPLVQELTRLGTGVRRGQVIAALSGSEHQLVAAAIERRGLDCQIVTNRSELMILPRGVSKASGLEYAIEVLGRSPHTTLAMGDAENDLAMLLSCEIGAAVGGSVEVLREHADVVASASNGEGVAEILRGPIFTEGLRVHSERWQIAIGTDPTGSLATVPASQVNILVGGPSGSGKSYVAGLLAEQLIGLGYDLLVFDPEGDYATLGELPGVITLGERAIPEADDVIAFLGRRGSVVVDLSAHSSDSRDEFMTRFAPLLAAFREKTGRPDWVLIDEAQVPYGQHSPLRRFYQPHLYSHLVVTYQLAELDQHVLDSIDITLTPTGDYSTVLVSRRDGTSPGLAVKAVPRQLGHLRHEHKYAVLGVPAERGFWFRAGPGPANGIVAHNLEELRRILPTCSDDTLRHHASGHEFSLWVDTVFAEHTLAAEMAPIESKIERAEDAARLRQACRELEAVIADRIRSAELEES
jgi:hydroxymethylpyrimidine pyrophosphatase-like HAD family hydrolase